MCLLSLITVCLNTPKTFEIFPFLIWPVLTVDLFIVLTFSIEALLKANVSGYQSVKIQQNTIFLFFLD